MSEFDVNLKTLYITDFIPRYKERFSDLLETSRSVGHRISETVISTIKKYPTTITTIALDTALPFALQPFGIGLGNPPWTIPLYVGVSALSIGSSYAVDKLIEL